jgi:hypothetical protein
LLRAVYERSELVRACIDTLIEFVSAVEWQVKPRDEDKSEWLRDRRPEKYQEQMRRIKWAQEFIERPNRHQSQNSFHRILLRDLLIYDFAAFEIVTAPWKGRDIPIELGVIPGDTVEIETDDSGIPLRYWQSYNVLREQCYEWDEVGTMMVNPCSWQPYGFSAIETFFVSIAADLNANSYNNKLFEKNGIPPALLAILGVSEAQFRAITGQMRNTSADNPHNIHAFRAQRNPDGSASSLFELIPLSQVSNRDMQHKELLTYCVNRVCMAFKITPSQIGFTEGVTGGIGSGVAETQVDLTENKGVAPLLQIISETYSDTLMRRSLGWDDLIVTPAQSNTPQEQQEYQRDSQECRDGIMTINEFRKKWGGRDPVDWGDLPLAAPQGWQPPMDENQMQQQMQQQMGGGGQPPPGGQPQPPAPGNAQGEEPDRLSKSSKRLILRI